jgi:hypothetical protein
LGTTTRRLYVTGKEVCEIIAACKEAGVVSLKYGALELSFIPVQNEQVTQYVGNTSAESFVAPQREPTVEDLLIEDPMAYEKLFAEG